MQLGISNDGIFSLVELNQYQTLAHLNLRLKVGNDEALKKYLAGKLKEYKELNESLKTNVESLNEAYGKSTNTNEQIMMEFNQLREEKRRIVDKL